MTGVITAKAAKLAVALLASAAVAAVAAGMASASPTVGASPSLKFAGSDGIGALATYPPSTKVSFEATYDAEGYYGSVHCVGHHLTNAKKGYPGTAPGSSPEEGGRDVEKCKSATGKALIGLTPGETVALGAGWFPGSSGWDSDYDGQGATEIGYTVSASGKSFKLVAYYPYAD